MTDSIFDLVARKLEEATGLDKLEARGTLRIALKSAGLDPKCTTPEQMSVALARAMPKELESRGIAHASTLCHELSADVRTLHDAESASAAGIDLPEDVFRRLGRS